MSSKLFLYLWNFCIYGKFKEKRGSLDDGGFELDGDPEEIDLGKRFHRVSDADLQSFFNKNRAEIDPTDYVYVEEDKIKDLVRDGNCCGKFIACVKSTDIQKLRLDAWVPLEHSNVQKLKELVTRVFKECSKVIEIEVGLKIIEDSDLNFNIAEANYVSGDVYYKVTRK